MANKHTQGKAYLQKYTDAYTNIVRCDNGKGFETLYIASTPDRKNAKHIVKCWNMHNELLEALLRAKQTIHIYYGEYGWDTYQNSPEMKKINDAIKKAIK